MQESSFFKFCISACIFTILISLSMNFVLALGVFHTNVPSPITNQTTGNITKIAGGDFISILTDNFGTILSGVITGSVIIGGLLVYSAARTGSWTAVAAYIFSVIFWVSWGTNWVFINEIGGYFLHDSVILNAFFLMITVVMTFIFAGAVLGILGGGSE